MILLYTYNLITRSLYFRYAVPPKHGRRLERLATNYFTEDTLSCSAFLRHKMTVISPYVLKKNSIPYDKVRITVLKKLYNQY